MFDDHTDPFERARRELPELNAQLAANPQQPGLLRRKAYLIGEVTGPRAGLKEAVELAEKGVDLRAAAKAVVKEAEALLAEDRADEAVVEFERAICLDEENGDAHAGFLRAVMAGNYPVDEAVPIMCRQFAERFPDHVWAERAKELARELRLG